ncbi:MAG: GIY-YIG nuclease family protein [Patescibacteria group bacterium]
MFYVYILKSQEGKYYVGQTNNLELRLKEHNEGKKGFTKKYTGWKLVHTETFQARSEALKRERKIKSLKFGETFRKVFDSYRGVEQW